MKIDRLIAIVTLLLQEDKLTAPELARRFEVSRRTITRDVDHLCKAGIPVTTAQGYGGGISIEKGYSLDKTVFTKDELQTLFAGLQGMSSVTSPSSANRLLEKMYSRHTVTTDCFIIDLASFWRPSLTQKIEWLKAAILNRHQVSFRYEYSKSECSRTIEPYHIVFKWSSWYVFGYCLIKHDFRLFKLNRLWDLADTEQTYAPRCIPSDKLNFDDHLTQAQAHLKAVFSASERYRLIDEYGIDCYTVSDNNELLFERDFASYENMREWILSFGSKVTVCEPAELKQDIITEAKKILAAYKHT